MPVPVMGREDRGVGGRLLVPEVVVAEKTGWRGCRTGPRPVTVKTKVAACPAV